MKEYRIKDIPKHILDEIFESVKREGYSIEIRDSLYIKENGACGGFFDGERIVVAGRSKKSGYILLHEVAHSQQLSEKHPLWNNYNPWNKKFDIKRFPGFFDLICLERDCEKRVVKFAKKHDLFDVSDYQRSSNAYLFKYQFMFLMGKWVSFKELYCKEILDKMPDKIVSEKTLKNIDMDLMLHYFKVYESQKGRKIH